MAHATTDLTFQKDVMEGKGLILVDFWAEWCGPCRAIGPILDEIATSMAGQVTVVKINIDENPQTPGRYGVRSIPTLLLFKDGEVLSTKIGGLPKKNLEDWIKSSL